MGGGAGQSRNVVQTKIGKAESDRESGGKDRDKGIKKKKNTRQTQRHGNIDRNRQSFPHLHKVVFVLFIRIFQYIFINACNTTHIVSNFKYHFLTVC